MPRVVQSAQLEPIVAPVCQAHGVDLVDVRMHGEPGGAVLRVLIEHPFEPVPGEPLPKDASGVTLDDCTRVSRALSEILDAHEDLLPGAYRLEVSSPGVERPLVKPRDFERYAGREIRVQSKAHIAERKNFTGILVGLKADQVLLRDEHGDEIEIPLSEIQKSHLVYRF